MDPSNVSIERSFGILKALEARYETIGLTNLLESTKAAFNKLDQFIDEASDEFLILANRFVI